jgi:hypothetical protein
MAEALEYTPVDPVEARYFEQLWGTATKSAPGGASPLFQLAGLDAVTFFQRSGVDKGFLKMIWSLSTPSATMNQSQFYIALRFITLIQNGEIPISAGKSLGVPIAHHNIAKLTSMIMLTTERLNATKTVSFGLPTFTGIELPGNDTQIDALIL